MFKYFFLAFAFLFVGCSEPEPQKTSSESKKLSILLEGALKTAPYAKNMQQESIKLSKDIFTYTQKLRQKFKRTSSPLYHNFLVNVNLKEKGLCYHWSDALYLHLNAQQYTHFKFHLVGANIGKYWSEHNALVITGKKDQIQKGILIDPWRNLHSLYFGEIHKDKAYQWTHRATRGCLR